jgi:FKBP-type peptidyl-prolyl cis-trans isomerase
MKQLPRLLLGAAASVSLIVFGAACGGDDDKSSSQSTSQSTSAPGGMNVAPGGANVTSNSSAQFDKSKATSTPSGLMYIDTQEGSGTSPTMLQSVTVHYTGKLASDGKVFDSSVTRGQPATFPMGGVIKGFSEGISTMKPGGKRTVLIPAALAYGANPPPGSGIPANADLIFEIELISVR